MAFRSVAFLIVVHAVGSYALDDQKFRGSAQRDEKREFFSKSAEKPANNQDHASREGLAVLKGLNFNPRNILDIGANVGDWTRTQRSLFPEAHFMMVDGWDHRSSWTDLLSTGLVDSEIGILGEKEKNVQWYAHGATGDSVHQELSREYLGKQSQSKQMVTLDGLLQKKGWGNRKVDLVKLDVQGSELDVLRGAQKVLTDAQVVLMEMPFAGTFNQGAPSFLD